MSTSADGRLTSRIVASVALALYSGAVAFGFVRVFSDGSFAGDLAVVIIVGHGLSLLLRRVHLAVALPVQIIVMVWLIGVLCHPETLGNGFPTGATWEAIGGDITFAREEFPTAVAPVDYNEGWSTLTVIGIELSVLLADVFAFRARTRFEALVPGGVLFVVVGALGTGEDQVLSAMLIVLSGVLAVAALRTHQVRPPRTLVGRAAPPLARVAMGAIPLGVMTALIAGVIGPALPGAGSEALYEPISGDGVTHIGSPLVDIRSRLVNQSDEELFHVTASQPAYWRLTTLSEFDGRSWRLPERSTTEGGSTLGTAAPGTQRIDQSIVIGSLGGRLVPAAAEPVQATGRTVPLRWSADAATLLAGSDGYERGDVFDIVSAAPRFSPTELAATSSSEDIDPAYLELPDDFPEAASTLAASVTAGAWNDYERALLLQDWFRSEFTYSLEVERGHGNDAMEDFLDRRTGYCEQFAGTFAAMARDLGMAARVAVGYTPGDLGDDGTYSVAGRNADAWPEVWFAGYGWVPFEPTPGRGAPGAEGHTGVRPDQEEAPPEPVTTTTVPGTLPGPGAPPPTEPRLGGGLGAGSLPPTATTVPTASTGGGSVTTALIVLGVLAALGLVAACPAILRRRRHARWRGDPQTAVADIWARVQRLIGATGVGINAAQTPTEFAVTAARVVPGASTEIRSLAGMVNRTLYGPTDGIRDDAGVVCAGWYSEIVRHTSMLLPMQQRLWRYISARD